MVITNISDAKASLSQLVERAARGERIVIGKAGKPMAVLVAYAQDPAPRELGGDWEGRVHIPEDFDQLPEEVAAAFGVDAPPPASAHRE